MKQLVELVETLDQLPSSQDSSTGHYCKPD